MHSDVIQFHEETNTVADYGRKRKQRKRKHGEKQVLTYPEEDSPCGEQLNEVSTSCNANGDKHDATFDEKTVGIDKEKAAPERDDLAKFVTRHFRRRECIHFVANKDNTKPNKNKEPWCFCGQTRSKHYPNMARVISPLPSLKDFVSGRPGSPAVDAGFQSKPESPHHKWTQGLNFIHEPLKRKNSSNILISNSYGVNQFLLDDCRVTPVNGVVTGLTPVDVPTLTVETVTQDFGSRSSPSKLMLPIEDDVVHKENFFVDPSLGDVGDVFYDDEWNPTSCFKDMATNAFGRIDFINAAAGMRKPAKYVRLTDDTDMNLVLKLMTDYWQMLDPYPPNLLISVNGGAKNFKLSSKYREVFNQGLIKAAETTRAWIITGGTNVGVMKAVGDALVEGQSFVIDNKRVTHAIRCIGIAPWGYLQGNERLIDHSGQGCFNAKYKSMPSSRGKLVSLNMHHTHFLLVDNGYRNKYGGVANFRACLERKISQPPFSKGMSKKDAGLGIPVVHVVLEGGSGCIDDVQHTLHQGTPVLLCQGTGRAADILSYAVTHIITFKGERILSDKHKNIVGEKLNDAYRTYWRQAECKAKAKQYLEIIIDCCKHENLVTVFNLDQGHDIDLAILSALLKGKSASRLDQLRLALTWNRSDVAADEIFTDDATWEPGSLDDIMTLALKEDKVDFVRLMLENGVVVREYLTVSRLCELYCVMDNNSHVQQLLLQYSSQKVFMDETDGSLSLLADVLELLNKLLFESKHPDNDLYLNPIGDKVFQDPTRQLFFWAVLLNRQNLAKFIWERCEWTIATALAATIIYWNMSKRCPPHKSDLLESYKRNKIEFENLAVKVLEQCNMADQEGAVKLVKYKSETWGDKNCLEMAYIGVDRLFMSTPACQRSIYQTWKKGLMCSSYKILPAALFPPLILMLHFDEIHERKRGKRLSSKQKLIRFYTAPITTFATTAFMYVLFLFLFSFVMLFKFEPYVTVWEFVLLAWIGTFFCELIREVITQPGRPQKRLYLYLEYTLWNRMDFVALLLVVVALSIRSFNRTFEFARMFYCLALVTYCLKTFRLYMVSSYLGPKLVMIKRMTVDVMYFVFILIVFLFSYGVTSQALLYPEREPYLKVWVDIMYNPYWQIYGELLDLDPIDDEVFSECVYQRGGGQSINATGAGCTVGSARGAWLVPVFLAVYLLIGNVLMLNLLIAIFSHVFEEVHQNSMTIWKYEMYHLVREFDGKPALVPPFVVIEHVFSCIAWLTRRTCRKPGRRSEEFPACYTEHLQLLEKECMFQFLRLRDSEITPVDRRFNEISTRLDDLARVVEEESQVLFDNSGLERLCSVSSVSSQSAKYKWPSLAQLGINGRKSSSRIVVKDVACQTVDSNLSLVSDDRSYVNNESINDSKQHFADSEEIESDEENFERDEIAKIDTCSHCSIHCALSDTRIELLERQLLNYKQQTALAIKGLEKLLKVDVHPEVTQVATLSSGSQTPLKEERRTWSRQRTKEEYPDALTKKSSVRESVAAKHEAPKSQKSDGDSDRTSPADISENLMYQSVTLHDLVPTPSDLWQNVSEPSDGTTTAAVVASAAEKPANVPVSPSSTSRDLKSKDKKGKHSRKHVSFALKSSKKISPASHKQ